MDMEQIYCSEALNIKFQNDNVSINDIEIPPDQQEGLPTEDYAKRKMRKAYGALISKQYENIIVLSGAGSSVGIGTNGKVGKTMKELWLSVVSELGFEKLEEFAKRVKFVPIERDYTDLEALLSHAILAQSYYHRATIKNMLRKIESIIRNECNLTLPDISPHSIFIRKITARKLKYSRVKVFTLNYDLLFEQAASKGGYVVIDGFSFNTPRLFNGTNFDYDIVIRNTNRAISEENFTPKVFHLYKMHGSLDWERIQKGETEEFIKTDAPITPVIIYPSNAKYEASYEQPYFEMISRFQQELRNRNTLLIVVGFSFYDKHIKAMIMESLTVNQSITMLVISPDIKNDDKYRDIKEKAKSMKNVVLASESFSDFAKYFPYSDIYDYSEGELPRDESI